MGDRERWGERFFVERDFFVFCGVRAGIRGEARTAQDHDPVAAKVSGGSESDDGGNVFFSKYSFVFCVKAA